MKPIQLISQDLFDKVRSRFTNLEMGDETGAVTIDPAEARFFDFDFVNEGVDLGRVSMSLNDLGSLKIYYSQGITENQDDRATQMWYNFLKEMRLFAMRRLLRFDTRDIAKTNLDKNDFQHLAATQGPKEEPDMNTMNESRWNEKSSRKTSRAVQGKTEVIVRHAHPVEETYPGARSQSKNIRAIFIQNADGERFKYPFIHTAGAFAMAQHVDHGGVPHDPAGKAIIKMSENIAKLGEFQRHIQRSSLHADAHGIAERAIGHMNELKTRIAALGKRHHYQAWKEEFEASGMGEPADEMMLDAVTLEDYKSKFTQTNFQEELVGFFPLLHSIMRETNTVDLEDYVAEKSVVEGSHEDDVARLAAYNEKMAGENPPIELGLREVGNWAKVGHYGDPIKTAWLNIAKYGIRNNRFNNSVEKTMDFISNIPDMDPEELYDIYNLDESDANNLYNSYETVYDQWDASQGMGEATALQSLGGNPRFAQNRPMPQHGSAPWEDDGAYYVMHTNVRTSESDPYKGPFASEQEAQAWIDSESPDPETYSVGTPGNIGPIDHGKPVNEPSNFSKPNNPNRTGMDSARALAQRGMSPAESINAFEEWANATEKGELTPDQMNHLKAAIEALPQGPNGPQLDAAIANDFFNDPEKGLTELPNFERLTQALQDEEVRDEEIRATPLQLFQSWAKEYNPDLLAALGMTGAEEPAPAPEAPPAPAASPAPEQPVAEGKSSMVQEVAKIVKSFYNADNESVGPFRAEENIALDCKKQVTEKFGEKAGEQAYEMAEAFINKLTQEWQQKHGKIQKHSPIDQGDGFSVDGLKEILSRIKGKVEGMGQPEMEEKDDWHPSKHVTDPQKKQELEPYNKLVDRGDYNARAAYLDAAGVKRDEPEDEGFVGNMIDKAKGMFGKTPAAPAPATGNNGAHADGKPNSWMEPDMRKDFENTEISTFLLYNIRMIYRWAKEGRNIRNYIQDLKKLEHENISKPTTAAAFKFIMDNLASGEVTDPKMIMQIADKAHTLMGHSDIEQATREGVDKSQVPAVMRKEKGDVDWKMSTQDLEKERDQSRTTKPGLDAHKAKLGMSEEIADIMRLVNHKK